MIYSLAAMFCMGQIATVVPGSIQSSMLFAVSKTSDVTDGWHFMAINSTGPYKSANNSVPDSVFIGFTDDAITATSFVSVPLAGGNASEFIGGYATLNKAFYNIPKNVSVGPSVYEETVPHGIMGIHYSRFDFSTDIGIKPAGLPTPVRQVAASSGQPKYQKYIVSYNSYNEGSVFLCWQTTQPSMLALQWLQPRKWHFLLVS